MSLWVVAVSVLLLNFPFGYWRANVKKFSLQWALAIHVPVPFIILLRLESGIGFAFITYPVLVSAFFLGQYIGKKFFIWWKANRYEDATSCLVWDLVNYAKLGGRKEI
jgi:hypothetical protein